MAVKISNPITIVQSGGGGGGAPDPTKLIRFFDYDGTLLYSYTQAEAQDLTEMPAHPTHDGLVADGWTHTLQEVKAHKYCDVGATYLSAIGTEDTTFFRIWPKASLALTIRFQQDVSDGVTIDWGDGSATETVSGTGSVSASHTYGNVVSDTFPYVLSLTPSSGTTLTLGGGSSSTSFFSTSGTNNDIWYGSLEGFIGKASLAAYAFYYAPLITLGISKKISGPIPSQAFARTSLLHALILPQNLTYSNSYSVLEYSGINRLIYSPSFSTFIGQSYYVDQQRIDNLVVPPAMNQPDLGPIKAKFVRVQDHTILSNTYIKVDSGFRVLDFRDCTNIFPRHMSSTPTLYPYQRIVVPDNLYASWIAHRTWSAFASYIVKASDYEAGGGI